MMIASWEREANHWKRNALMFQKAQHEQADQLTATEHRLTEALKHLEDAERIFCAFTDVFRSDERGHDFSELDWWQNQVEPWRERYSNFLKAQKVSGVVQGANQLSGTEQPSTPQ